MWRDICHKVEAHCPQEANGTCEQEEETLICEQEKETLINTAMNIK